MVVLDDFATADCHNYAFGGFRLTIRSQTTILASTVLSTDSHRDCQSGNNGEDDSEDVICNASRLPADLKFGLHPPRYFMTRQKNHRTRRSSDLKTVTCIGCDTGGRYPGWDEWYYQMVGPLDGSIRTGTGRRAGILRHPRVVSTPNSRPSQTHYSLTELPPDIKIKACGVINRSIFVVVGAYQKYILLLRSRCSKLDVQSDLDVQNLSSHLSFHTSSLIRFVSRVKKCFISPLSRSSAPGSPATHPLHRKRTASLIPILQSPKKKRRSKVEKSLDIWDESDNDIHRKCVARSWMLCTRLRYCLCPPRLQVTSTISHNVQFVTCG
ncbi:hypothetical protein F4604DRAFT_1899892 [Suillus subluteus]|nr:hypothetical protein F4604DRAFT_1899892 [Suillus subluteus]